MEYIDIEEKEKNADGWVFVVKIGGGEKQTMHEVTLPKNYYDIITSGDITPEELINNSFIFLLEREPKESILGKFHLHEIQRYFPEYENEIGNLSEPKG